MFLNELTGQMDSFFYSSINKYRVSIYNNNDDHHRVKERT